MEDSSTHSYSYPSTFSELTTQPHYPIGHVLLQNLGLFEQMGLAAPLDQKLGKGSFGCAYEVPLLGKSVLKLTRDPTEVQAAVLLVGRDTSRVVRIYGAWAIKGTFTDGLRGWYAIHRDYLTPLSKRDARLVEAIFQVYGDTSLDLVIPRSRRQHATIQKWRGWLRSELMGGDSVQVDEDGGSQSPLGGKMVQRAIALLLQIGEGVDEMHKAGVDWEDIHPGNIMRDATGRLVIADVGWGLMHDDFSKEVPFLSPETLQHHIGATVTGTAQ